MVNGKALSAVLSTPLIDSNTPEGTKLMEYVQSRNSQLSVDQGKDFAVFRLFREFKEIVKDPDRAALLNNPDKLKTIQELVKVGTQKLELKIQQGLAIQQSKQQTVRQGGGYDLAISQIEYPSLEL